MTRSEFDSQLFATPQTPFEGVEAQFENLSKYEKVVITMLIGRHMKMNTLLISEGSAEDIKVVSAETDLLQEILRHYGQDEIIETLQELSIKDYELSQRIYKEKSSLQDPTRFVDSQTSQD